MSAAAIMHNRLAINEPLSLRQMGRQSSDLLDELCRHALRPLAGEFGHSLGRLTAEQLGSMR